MKRNVGKLSARAAGITIWLATAFVAVAIALVPSVAGAHGGGLDGLGCHHDRKAGGYHCHRGALAGQSFASKVEAERALQGAREQPPKAIPAPSRPAPATAAIAGRASVIDGDTLEIHGRRIRLHGIDAPESGQTCRDGQGRDYRCGQSAALALADKIGQGAVACEQRDIDRYKRIVAVCRLGNEDLNGWLVREGLAVAYRQFSNDYVRDEEGARAAKRGMWSGSFTLPEEWRRSQR